MRIQNMRGRVIYPLVGLLIGLLPLLAEDLWGVEDSTASDIKLVREVIEQYRKGWLQLDQKGLEGLWAKDYPHIVYVAVELKDPIYGWPGVKAYYEKTTQELAQVKAFTLKDLSVDILDGLALAFATYHFEALSKQGKEPFVGDGRITFVLKKVGGRWLFIHYHESANPPSPTE